MSSPHAPTLARSVHLDRVVAGVAGGLAGGVLFGILMHLMDMLPMVAMLVGSESVAVGWLVHLANSALFGAVFAVVVGLRARPTGAAVALGLAYGVLLWVVGALLIMPAWLGMPVLTFNQTAWQSLGGHLVFGAALGLVFSQFVRRTGH